MVLESCMVLLDNSEYMRNGDYVPTRLEAQHDAANMIVGTKTQSNPESTVGVICMTGEMDGSGAELLISPTDDMGKILTALHGVPIRSSAVSSSSSSGSDVSDGSDITAAIQVASLALKHRRNKNGAQRVVVFVGSPLTSDERALQKCGRTLKKNNIAVDVICLGELEENEAKLQTLVDTANGTNDEGANTCHLVTIPAGVLPSDILVNSPIVAGAGAGGYGGGGAGGEAGAAAGGGGAGGAGFADYGGVDPSMDPELAMALRVSMEEERARQERLTAERGAEGGGEAKEGEAAGDGDAPMAAAEGGAGENPDEDALLQQALAMSMQEDSLAAGGGAAPAEGMDTSGGGDDDDDAAMQMALAMSVQEDSAAPEASAAEGQDSLRQRAGKKDSDTKDDADDAGNKKDD